MITSVNCHSTLGIIILLFTRARLNMKNWATLVQKAVKNLPFWIVNTYLRSIRGQKISKQEAKIVFCLKVDEKRVTVHYARILRS